MGKFVSIEQFCMTRLGLVNIIVTGVIVKWFGMGRGYIVSMLIILMETDGTILRII